MVLGLFLSSSAYSKIIELKKCAYEDASFDSKRYIKSSLIIDTDKRILQRVKILTDSHYEDQKKKFLKEFGDLKGLDKISVTTFKLDYFDHSFAKASYTWDQGRRIWTWEIDLKKKTGFFKSGFKNSGALWKCK